jgi:hypothetical protein
MNMRRVVGGGIAGGVALNLYWMLFSIFVLGGRYEILQAQGVFRKEPRVFFLPVWLLVLFLVSIGLVWLYAAARTRLGPGPVTALKVGLVTGLIAGVPLSTASYAWSYQGGFVSLGQTLQMILGCVLATLVGGWVYKEG